MPQLQAGYFVNAIYKEFLKGKQKNDVKKLLFHLSHFDLITDSDLTVNNPDGIVVTLNNLISRGLPTFASTFIEDRIATTFIKTKKVTEDNKFSYQFVNDELNEEIFRSLFIIDPRIKIDDLPAEFFKNKDTKQFLKEFLPINIGEFFAQIAVKDRIAEDIFKNSDENTSFLGRDCEHNDEKFDLSFELPYKINQTRGLNIQFSSPKEELHTDFLGREKFLQKLSHIGWNSNVIVTDLNNQDDENIQKIISFTFDDYFDNLRKNYSTPLYNSEYGLNAMQIALTPLAVARLQKTILSFILSGDLSLTAKEWNIAVIERDVPAAFLAVEDLQQHFKHLFQLEGKGRKLPKINLSIYYTDEFETAELNVLYQGEIAPISEFPSKKKFDLLIDLSILMRSAIDNTEITTNAKVKAKIRSVSYLRKKRDFITAEPFPYVINFYENTSKTSDQKAEENRTIEDLNFFFKNLFHRNKISFFQYRFLSKILSGKNSLCVVPNSEEKDILYKFATLLQPAVALIVTPLMSTLKQQFDELFEYQIDAASYYSASTQKIYDKYEALNKLKHGRSLYNYITPDRLHLPEFRNVLREMQQNNVALSFVVVDEAHCASEWSHDFRPLYGTIPRNLEIIFGKNFKTPFACLTEIASYDVVENIKYLYNIDEEQVLKIDSSFSQLNFKIYKDNFELKQTSPTIIQELLENKIKKHRDTIENKTVIISSDTSLAASNAQKDNLQVAEFQGTIGDKLRTISTLKSRQSYRNLRSFNKGETDVLSAIFSVGIGVKLNAKKLILSNIPTSIEHFIQTLGRLQNNEKIEVNILFSDQPISKTISEIEFNDEGDLIEKEFSAEINIEELSRRNIFRKLYGTAKKTNKILHEIMDTVTYPTESIGDILVRRIRYSYDMWVRLESQPQENPVKLYVYDDQDDILGFIDFEKDEINNTAHASKRDIADQILAFLKFDIEKIVSSGIEIFQILDDEISMSPTTGINGIWTSLKKNEQATLTLEFYNDTAKIVKKIKKQKDISVHLNQIIDLYEFSDGIDSFLSNFKEKFELSAAQYKEINLDIQKLYWSFRNFFDTLIVVYRLFSIGILDDFIIDYQNQQFTLILTKKSDTQIINNIYNILARYISKNQAFRVYEKLPQIKGETIISKSLRFYEKFVNDYIYRKRLLSNEKMLQLISENTENTDRILPFINSYFYAKYIYDLENVIKNNDFSPVENYFIDENLIKDDILHLNKSSEILLNTYENNHILLIINGVSGIIANSEKNEKLPEYIEKLAQGLSIYRQKAGEENTNISEKIEFMFDVMTKFNIEIRTKIEDLLILKIHSHWLANFNKQIKQVLKNL